MQKTMEYKMNRVIDTIKINNELVAYSDKLYRDGGLIKETEGIALQKAIEQTIFDESIENYKTEVRKGIHCFIGLFDKGIKEAVRKFSFGSDKSIEEYKKYIIKEPYSYIKDLGMNEDACLMYLSYYDHNLYDENFIIQPKAMYFDYIYSHMNNRCYDLNQAIETLTKRSDIEWLDDNLQIVKEPMIKPIPYHNREEGCDQCLEFIWCPCEDDFEKVRDFITNNHSRYDEVCKNIFGLTKLNSF